MVIMFILKWGLLHVYCILLQLQPGVQQEIYRWSRDWWSTTAINKFLLTDLQVFAVTHQHPRLYGLFPCMPIHHCHSICCTLIILISKIYIYICIYPRHPKRHDIQSKCVFNLPLWRTIQSNLSLSRSLLENLSLELRFFSWWVLWYPCLDFKCI